MLGVEGDRDENGYMWRPHGIDEKFERPGPGVPKLGSVKQLHIEAIDNGENIEPLLE